MYFKGYLQCDGFAGYETAFKTNPDVTLVNCMVHIRHFQSALDENKAVAEHALEEIRHLYKIEHMCDKANLSFDERRERRQQLSKPIMESMKAWMETEGVKYSESSQTGKAITYAYTRWDNMMHYLEDGRILLDNNLAENEIRPITLGRLCVMEHKDARTTSSAATTARQRTWLSSARCWQLARHTMSIHVST